MTMTPTPPHPTVGERHPQPWPRQFAERRDLDSAAMSRCLDCSGEREFVLDMFEMFSGQRMMTSYIRPGGVWRDLTDDFLPTVNTFLDYFPAKIDDYETLLSGNPIFIDRTQGI